MLPYCGGKTYQRIRQDMEIWSLNTSRVITTSTTTPGWCFYGFVDISPQLPMAPQSYHWWWEVGAVYTSPVLTESVLAVDTYAPENKTTITPSTSKPVRWKRKNVKQSSWNSPNPKEFPEIKRSSTTVDTLKIPWARYGIRNTLHEQRIYSVINTCPLIQAYSLSRRKES